MIPVKIRTYKGSVLANAVSLIGTFIDAIVKLIGVACAFGIMGEIGFILGLLIGFVFMIASAFLGGLVQNGAWKLADLIQLAKIKKKLVKIRESAV